MAKDFYKILGVERTASAADIKSAYRKLSRELHPDKHKGDKEKEARFKEVNEAYEVLSDPEKKKRYDQFGSADGPQFGGGGAGFSGFENVDFGSFGEGFGNLFENFFGGARGARSGERANRGGDLEFALQISFEESVQGIEREIAFETLMQCDTCKGSGAKEGSKVITCDECNGTGQVMKTARTIFGMMQQASLCPRCKGSGKVPEYPCASCHGEGRKKGKKTVTVRIPAGIMSGQSIKIRGEGQAGKRNAASGDLFIAITVLPDPRFERDGDDVRSTAHIPLTTAVLGGKMDIVTVQGNVTLAIPAGTQSHETFRIRGKGMPVLNTHRHGDHFVTVIVDIPTKLSKQEKRIFEELQGGHS